MRLPCKIIKSLLRSFVVLSLTTKERKACMNWKMGNKTKKIYLENSMNLLRHRGCYKVVATHRRGNVTFKRKPWPGEVFKIYVPLNKSIRLKIPDNPIPLVWESCSA